MADKKTPSGQTRTGVTREKQGPVGGTKRTEVPTNPRLEVQTETSEAEGGAKRTAGNPADPGDRTEVASERSDSIVERGPIEEED